MKKILLLTIVMLSSAFLYAQDGRQRMTVEERAKATTEWMKTELKLTAEQIAPVDSVNLLFTKAQQMLFQSSTEGDRSKLMDQMTALNNEKDVALSKVLTAEQLEAYKKKNQEMMQNRRRPGGGQGQGQGQGPRNR